MMQSRVARKNVVLSNLRSHSTSVLRTTTEPLGITMRVRSPHASSSQMSAVRISQHFPLPLKKTKSSDEGAIVLFRDGTIRRLVQ
jgi:hypothetical protein